MKVKIRCHSCDGVGYFEETRSFIGIMPFLISEKVKVPCPECDGKGFVMVEKYVEEVNEDA